MISLLHDKYINTSLGTFKISVRNGNTLLVFLNGYGPYDTAQIFQPIIQTIPKEIGILAIDYLDSGLSSSSTKPFLLTDEANLVMQIIQEQNAQKIIIIAHSLGGLYALLIARNLDQLVGFIGIEPATREILLNPPHTPAYDRDAKEDAEISENEIVDLMHNRIYHAFPKDLADKIWLTSLDSEKRNEQNKQPHGLNLELNILNGPEFLNLKLRQTLPTILFVRPYRINEYNHSEYHTKKTSIVPLGKDHYIHFEFPQKINQAIQILLKENR